MLRVATVVLLMFGVAHATHPGSQSLYEILGFTADGKHVHFRKSIEAPPSRSRWHAVYDVATAKSLTAQPVFRDCGGVPCDQGAEISDKVGAKTTEELHKKYGAPVAASRLVPKTKHAGPTTHTHYPNGFVQVYTIPRGDVEVKTTTKLIGKLPDLDDGNPKSAQFEVELAVSAGTTKWTVKQKLYADSVTNLDNGNILEWPHLGVEHVAVSPDRKAIAVVFARKPYVIKPKS
jgi:hypothetical protein